MTATLPCWIRIMQFLPFLPLCLPPISIHTRHIGYIAALCSALYTPIDWGISGNSGTCALSDCMKTCLSGHRTCSSGNRSCTKTCSSFASHSNICLSITFLSMYFAYFLSVLHREKVLSECTFTYTGVNKTGLIQYLEVIPVSMQLQEYLGQNVPHYQEIQ